MNDVLYRYVRRYYEWEVMETTVNAKLVEYRIVKTTKWWVWISVPYWKQKFVLNKAKKKFAYPDKELARLSAIKRTKKCIQLLDFNKECAESFLESLITPPVE
jgi:hypothetical protein